MSKPRPRITIVGLGLIGGSMGLALREAGVASAVVGHDRDPGASSRAKKLGAVDKTDWNLISACEEADLVILAIPVGAIEETMQAIGPYMRPGSVVMDTASVKLPVLAWAAEALPDHVHYVGGDPIVGGGEGRAPLGTGQGGLESARADLFQKGLFVLTPAPSADPSAVKLASDLVMILGAKPVFFDPVEHDGLVAAVELLPAILGLALLETVIHQPAWRELRKVAGSSFEVSTHLASTEPSGYADLFLHNRDNILRWIDDFTASLAVIRQSLVQDQSEEITQRFEAALEERDKWLRDRAQGQWDGDLATQMPEKPNVLADAFLGGWWRKRQKQKKGE